MTKARLVLHNISEREADVYVHTPLGRYRPNDLEDEDQERIGRVYRHKDKYGGGEHILLWSARDIHEVNHGDSYLDAWSAAKQLAIGLKLGDQIGGL